MKIRTAAAACAAALLLAATSTTTAGAAPFPGPLGPQLERLDRGLVAAVVPQGVYLSWRLMGGEATGRGPRGLTGTDFRVFRDNRLIATVTDSTTYVDTAGRATSRYRIEPTRLGPGARGPAAGGDTVTPLPQAYRDLPLKKPADGVTPAGAAYTYSANDMSVGDVDGDGSYEYVVKWDPSNSKDNSQIGYTGNTYIDTYKADGTLLNRLDLGVNIRAGAHYTDFMVYDFDGDGRSEVMLKTAPGTKSISYDRTGRATERYITMPAADVAAGYANTDDYRLSKSGYYESVVMMFKGWSQRPEVVAGTWPKTLEAAFGIAPKYTYPLSDADARAMTDYFMDVFAPSRSANNKLRTFEGFILSGPEYLSVFDGATGRELQTITYEPGRGDDGLLWGDYAMGRIEPGNRVDRFLAGVAYLDGKRPSAVFTRGYYTRTTLHAYNWDGRRISKVWEVDSGHAPMTNPFNDSPHGRDGSNPEFATITTQGDHSLSAADVDGDGRQEVVFGSVTIDDNGKLRYSSMAPGAAEGPAPGILDRLGHGDAMHVTDIDPARPGLEIFTVHEGAQFAPFGYALRDAATGNTVYGEYTGKDTGRGLIGDVRPDVPGLETWATRLRSASGDDLGTTVPGTNQSIHWAGDMTTQTVNGSGTVTPTVVDFRRGTLLSATGTVTNNTTKGSAGLVADVFGDWREELLVRTADSSAIRMYFSTEPTDRKLYTLMHDRQYRVEVARQNTGYNQPSYPGFYMGSDIDWAKVPLPGAVKP